MHFPEIVLYPLDSKPFGCTYEQWIVKWWQWLLSIPKDRNPALDNSGVNAHVNQFDSEVFYLCQTMEGVKPMPIRKVTLPIGISFFMPIINWISITDDDNESDQELFTKAKRKIDVVSKLELTINNKTVFRNLEKFRIRTSVFHSILPENNIFDTNPGVKRMVSDGYWIFLAPIMEPVDLRSLGSCSAGITTIGVTYRIAVK
jgi:hypothetical protein